MSKYAALEKFLESKGLERIPMTFSDIERVIDDDLPPSARKHRAWWSNNPSNSVITYAWLAAGYRTAEVNLEGEKVTFVKDEATRTQPEQRKRKRRSIIGCMKGTIWVDPDHDLTQPADPDWGAVYDD